MEDVLARINAQGLISLNLTKVGRKKPRPKNSTEPLPRTLARTEVLLLEISLS
jgi:hypothetical protein